MGSCNPLIDIPKFVDLYRRGHFPVDRLITARMPLEEVNTALEEMAASRALRQILTP
jgi:alcohol dehydrogenase